MTFVSGPRQVGKTTTCRSLERGARYWSWDDQDDRLDLPYVDADCFTRTTPTVVPAKTLLSQLP